MSERRNDIGPRVGEYILIALIGFLLAIFFMGTYDMASDALAQSNELGKENAVLKTQYSEVIRRLECIESKQDISNDKLNNLILSK